MGLLDSVLEGLLEGVSVGEAVPTTGDREGDGVGLADGEIVGSLCCKESHGTSVSNANAKINRVDDSEGVVT